MSAVFGFRPGRSLKNLDPQEVGQELDRIRVEKGSLTPDHVVEAATAADSPLHNAFEWDDAVAAHQHRLTQARRLIVSIRIINAPSQAKTPAWVSVRTPKEGRQYLPTAEALSDEQLRARVLAEIQQFVESLERRYAYFSEAADIIDRLKKSAG